MKNLKILFFCVSLISILGCDKNESEDLKNLDVEKYVEQLKNGKYESLDLPEFSYEHIPILLMHINDTSVVKKFPHGVSSYHEQNPNYRLGVLVLWTIESIRAVSCGDTHNLRFPSQHPFIQLKNEPFSWIIDHDNEAYNIIRQAYLGWWGENNKRKFSDFHNIDPLLNTEYRWH